MGRLLIISFTALQLGLWPCLSQALTFDVNAFYFSDALASGTDSGYNRLHWDVAIMLNLSRKGNLVLGWSYGSVTASDENTSTTDYTSTEMGPRLGYYFDRSFNWALFATYNLVSTADFSSGSTTEEWRGNTIKGELAYMPPITEEMFFGLKIVYYKATFNEQVTASTTLATETRGRTMIYPALAFIYRWN